jgi:hypothetical protein
MEVVNRGRRELTGYYNFALQPPSGGSQDAIDAGDGWLMSQGWTLAWCGWQWDVLRSPGLLGLISAPRAVVAGHDISGQIVVRHQPTGWAADLPLLDMHSAGLRHMAYPSMDLEDPDATLTVREWPDAPPTTIPRKDWAFARDVGGQCLPVADHIWLKSGFEPGRIYEVIYHTSICPVVGVGLVAVREAASFLRYGDEANGNPCAGAIDYAYASGNSQAGRFLRTFLYCGQNLDTASRPVFDGMIVDVAGARRGEFNNRYAQPSVQSTPNFGHLFPFADDDQTDPVTGNTDGLLRRQRRRGGIPKVFYLQTASEYWRGDGALMHVDVTGAHDLEIPPEVRIYAYASTHHCEAIFPLTTESPAGGFATHNLNTIDRRPLYRAALWNLERWVRLGEQPPPNAVPRLRDGTASSPGCVGEALHSALPNIELPRLDRLQTVRRLDLGPDAARGVGTYPPTSGEPCAFLVSAVDSDGNELGGLRVPDVTVPLATHTGWNTRHPSIGGEGQLLDYVGATLPFPATAEERDRSRDPRPSIAERYRDCDEYLTLIRAAAQGLVDQRHLLSGDIEIVVRGAALRYDAFTRRAQGV